jgi:hypothetical protein
MITRAAHAWKLRRRLQTEPLPPPERERVEQELRDALAGLATSTLTGEAMYYRARAIEEDLPDRARRDWLALVRQRGWAEDGGELGLARLLWLGDRLRQVGEWKEAERGYQRAAQLGSPQAERLLRALPVCRALAEGADARPALQAVREAEPDSPLWPLLEALLALQDQPPAVEPARTCAQQARERGEIPATLDLLEALCCLAAAEPGAPQRLESALAGLSADLPPAVSAGLHLLAGPGIDAEKMLSFREAAGEQWPQQLSVDPLPALVALAQGLAGEGRFLEALEEVGRVQDFLSSEA